MFTFKQAQASNFSDLVDALFTGLETDSSDIQAFDTIREFDTGFIVDIELPGVKKDQVDVSVDGTTLVVTAKKTKIGDGKITSDSRRYGTFTKKYKLNTPVSNSEISAKMDDGVLSIRIPKSESSKARSVKID